MPVTNAADRAVKNALVSIDAGRKQDDREARLASAHAVVAGMMDRVRQTQSDTVSVEREAAARRREMLAQTPRGRRLLTGRA